MAQSPKKRKQMAMSSQFKLIGQFVSHWNILECQLDNSIIDLCKLETLHGRIVTANLNFQTKMNIITTMINLLSQRKPEDWIKSKNDTLAKIHSINDQWRNLVVHNLIVPIDTKTVEFLKISAKKKLHWPDTKRTKAQFNEVCNQLMELGSSLRKIAKELAPASTTRGLTNALATAPVSQPYMQGLAGFLHPPTLGLQHSRTAPANLGTSLGILSGLFPTAEEDKKD